MVVDYYTFDYEFAEPPRVTSMQNVIPLPTFANFGEDVYFVADQRGYESVVHHVGGMFLRTDKNDKIVDPRLMLNKVKLPVLCGIVANNYDLLFVKPLENPNLPFFFSNHPKTI